MHACPILLGYLSSLRKNIDFDSPLNEFGLPTQEELEQRFLTQVVSSATTHLRGFYCVQQTIDRLAVRWPSTLAWPAPPTFDRSAYGLTQVLSWVRGVQDFLEGNALETAVMQRTLPLYETGGGQVHQQDADRASKLCSYLVLEAIPLRRSLKNGDVGLRRVGHYYARVLLDVGTSITSLHGEALSLSQHVEESYARS